MLNSFTGVNLRFQQLFCPDIGIPKQVRDDIDVRYPTHHIIAIKRSSLNLKSKIVQAPGGV